MRVAQHVVTEHAGMFCDLAGSVQTTAGVVQIHLVLGVKAAVFGSPQDIQRTGVKVARMVV